MKYLRFSNHPLLLTQAFFISVMLTIILSYFFRITWETNDDIAMSMIAHGYGLASEPSVNIFFSNVIWGHIVTRIPEIFEVQGYSIATLCTLIIIGTVLIYGLQCMGVSYTSCMLIFLLIMVRAILFPQFTVNAGLLALCAFISIHLFAKYNQTKYLILCCFFAVFSYWIRGIEFLFVLFVSLPLLPWKSLIKKTPLIILLILFTLIILSTYVDRQSYQNEKWNTFIEFNIARAPITDYGADKLLLKQPALLEEKGYSPNDIKLIRSWFFIDPSINNPHTLKKMLYDLKPIFNDRKSFREAIINFLNFIRPSVIALTLTAILMFFINPSKKLASAWLLLFIATFVISLLGRSWVSRIYVPILCLLLIAPFLLSEIKSILKKYIIIILSLTTTVNISLTVFKSITFQDKATTIQQALRSFPLTPVFIWGSSFPYEAVYPVLSPSSSLPMSYQLYGLNAFTLAPFSVAYKEERQGRGFIDLLLNEKGIQVIATQHQTKLLKIYCEEHYETGILSILSTKHYSGDITLTSYHCKTDTK